MVLAQWTRRIKLPLIIWQTLSPKSLIFPPRWKNNTEKSETIVCAFFNEETLAQKTVGGTMSINWSHWSGSFPDSKATKWYLTSLTSRSSSTIVLRRDFSKVHLNGNRFYLAIDCAILYHFCGLQNKYWREKSNGNWHTCRRRLIRR